MEITSKPYLSLLFLYTKMRNVAGLSTADAQKSSDMFAKCRYLDETYAEIDGVRYAVREFAGRMEQNRISYAPA